MNFVSFCAGGTPTAKPSASVGACAFLSAGCMADGAVFPSTAIEKRTLNLKLYWFSGKWNYSFMN